MRMVLGLGTALPLACWLICCQRPAESRRSFFPRIVMGLVLFGVALYSRARSRREWSAAWDAYAEREVAASARDAQ